MLVCADWLGTFYQRWKSFLRKRSSRPIHLEESRTNTSKYNQSEVLSTLIHSTVICQLTKMLLNIYM